MNNTINQPYMTYIYRTFSLHQTAHYFQMEHLTKILTISWATEESQSILKDSISTKYML